jgi:hypothetical protein
MVAILRQPVGQLSTVHKPSIAAIDELLETPAKVEGLQGRFQAFEVSVTRETPMPAATLPRGAQNNVLFESSTAKALPAIDLGFHFPSDRLDLAESTAITFRSPVEAPAAGLVTTPIPIQDSLLTPGVLSVEAIDAVIGDLSSEAMHDALSSNFRLELATAALLAALIGRAVWPTRPPQAEGHEKRQRG